MDYEPSFEDLLHDAEEEDDYMMTTMMRMQDNSALEAMLAEEEETHHSSNNDNSNNSSSQAAATTAAAAATTTTNATTTAINSTTTTENNVNMGDDNVTCNNNDNNNNAEDDIISPPEAVREAFSRRSQETSSSPVHVPVDPFTFERYSQSVIWRKPTNNTADEEYYVSTATHYRENNHIPTTMVTSSGIFTTSIGSSSARRTAATAAPDVQLLEFLDRRHCCRRHCHCCCCSCSRSLVSAGPASVAVTPQGKMSTRPVPGRTCIAMTFGQDKRVYCARQTDNKQRAEASRKCSSSSSSSSSTTTAGYLLGEPMTSLLARVNRIRKQKELQNIQAQEAETPEQMPDELDNEAPMAMAASPEQHDNRLWVDKHAPQFFSHLLSDERTNREVLRALRAWDPYVFHRDSPERPSFIYGTTNGANNRQDSKTSKDNTTTQTPTNPRDKRPDESSRVLLLSGPPGVGKTTLAHIVAQHAGYRPLEVNGSDDRSASVLKEHVIRAMESSTLCYSNGQDSSSSSSSISKNKPNCLIIDEIDGADAKGAIQALMEIIRAKMPPKKGQKNGKNNNKASGGSTTYLRRPIIFICNNKYAPALRPLLPYARHFNIATPQMSRLVARLRSVLSSENLTLFGGGGGGGGGGSSLLNQLVAATCGDIRSCLYTLQFASACARVLSREDNGAPVDISKALMSALKGDGMKDERNDVSATITMVFRLEKDRKFGDHNNRRKIVAGGRSALDRVLDSVERFGDNSRMLDSLFINVPRVSYIDPTFDRCAAACEWLSSSDLYRAHGGGSSSMKNAADMYVMEALHIPVAAGATHLLCRVEQKQDLVFTLREMLDSKYLRESNLALVQKFVDGLSTEVGGSRCLWQVGSELIPFVLWILSAGEGSSALQRAATSVELLSKGEGEAFDAHVAALQGLGLSYVVAQHGENARESRTAVLSMVLEPPISKLAQFGGGEMGAARQDLSVAIKELVARALVHQRIYKRRLREVPAAAAGNIRSSEVPDKNVESNKRRSPEKLSARPAKRAKDAPVTVDFLKLGAQKAKEAQSARNAARVGIQRSNQTKKAHTGSGVPLSQVIRLKYVKGFTQAVRTQCKVEDLL